MVSTHDYNLFIVDNNTCQINTGLLGLGDCQNTRQLGLL